jgi:hypothetical protein
MRPPDSMRPLRLFAWETVLYRPPSSKTTGIALGAKAVLDFLFDRDSSSPGASTDQDAH